MFNLSLFLIIIALFCNNIQCAIIGIDFGTELLKISLVKPGYPFETVTDFNSRRLSPSSIAFYDGDRLFGDDALNIGSKKPDYSYSYIKTLIGLNHNISDDHMLNILRFPYTMIENDRGTITFKLAEPIHGFDEFSIEELMGMLMGYIKIISENFGKDKVRDCVITVPSSYTQYQRRATIDAAESVGLSVLSLIDENTAAALQYGLDRVFENQTHYALIYNFGSLGTEVTIAKYYTIKKKDTPERYIEVISKAWDPSLGCLLVDANLMKIFEEEYYKKYNNNEDISKNKRSNAKMRATAQKTKKVLSANKNLPITVESIFGDNDLHIKNFDRENINKFVDQYKDRFTVPVEKALKLANLTKDQLDVFEIIGGGVRIPRVQEILKDYYGRDLNNHLNGDESMAFGAAFRGANISKSFKVRFVGLTDISEYQASVSIYEDPSTFVPTDSQKEPWSKNAILFPIGSAYGSRKVVSFSRDKSFLINLHYDETDLFPKNMEKNIISVNVTGIEEACQKYSELGKPKIHLSFLLSDSGTYEIARADAEWEEIKLVPEEKSIFIIIYRS